MSDQRKSSFATVNPATGETVAEFPAIEGEEVDAALDLAGRAFSAWRERTVSDRAAVVGRAASLMRERKEELARTITLEMGKLISEARGEVDLAASILEYYAEHGPAFAADEPLDVEEGEAYLVNEPLGVLLGVMPWNFPLYQVVRFAGPNLVLGNIVLVKHAGICPQSALALEALFRDAHAPEGVYTNLFVSHDEISRIIDSPVVRGASLTGSEAAGAQVAERAGRNMKPSLLELGGELTGVKPGMRAYAEELFGPAAVVYRVADEDEAVALANDSQYGLGGSVFGADLDRARRVAERVETGMVWVNHPTSTQPDLPFGGIKRSGYGRELSKLGMQEFVNRKLVRILPPDAELRGIAG